MPSGQVSTGCRRSGLLSGRQEPRRRPSPGRSLGSSGCRCSAWARVRKDVRRCVSHPPVRRSFPGGCTRGPKWMCGPAASSCTPCSAARCPLTTRTSPTCSRRSRHGPGCCVGDGPAACRFATPRMRVGLTPCRCPASPRPFRLVLNRLCKSDGGRMRSRVLFPPLLQGGIYTLPSHLSPGARDLIPRMLLVDPLKRITIPEIRRGLRCTHLRMRPEKAHTVRACAARLLACPPLQAPVCCCLAHPVSARPVPVQAAPLVHCAPAALPGSHAGAQGSCAPLAGGARGCCARRGPALPQRRVQPSQPGAGASTPGSCGGPPSPRVGRDVGRRGGTQPQRAFPALPVLHLGLPAAEPPRPAGDGPLQADPVAAGTHIDEDILREVVRLGFTREFVKESLKTRQQNKVWGALGGLGRRSRQWRGPHAHAGGVRCAWERLAPLHALPHRRWLVCRPARMSGHPHPDPNLCPAAGLGSILPDGRQPPSHAILSLPEGGDDRGDRCAPAAPQRWAWPARLRRFLADAGCNEAAQVPAVCRGPRTLVVNRALTPWATARSLVACAGPAPQPPWPAGPAAGMMATSRSNASLQPAPRLVVERRWRLGVSSRAHPSSIMQASRGGAGTLTLAGTGWAGLGWLGGPRAAHTHMRLSTPCMCARSCAASRSQADAAPGVPQAA